MALNGRYIAMTGLDPQFYRNPGRWPGIENRLMLPDSRESNGKTVTPSYGTGERADSLCSLEHFSSSGNARSRSATFLG